MARRAKRRIFRGMARGAVRLERVLVQSLMLPVVLIADRRITKHLRRTD